MFINRMINSFQWDFLYQTESITDGDIQKMCINVKIVSSVFKKLLAVSNQSFVYLYDLTAGINIDLLLKIPVETPLDVMFFTSAHLVGLSKSGIILCWHSVSKKYKIHETSPYNCHDIVGNLLLFATKDGVIKRVNFDKFALRITDDGLLISDLYDSDNSDEITAISLYTRVQMGYIKDNISYWLELAYGTASGVVYVLGHHPETVGAQLRIFYVLTVHSEPIQRVILSEKYLFTICGNNFHVRTWSMSRFRDMLNTQPGPTSIASYNIYDSRSLSKLSSLDQYTKGPYIYGTEKYFFAEHFISSATKISIRSAVYGDYFDTIESADNSQITSFCTNCPVNEQGLNSRASFYFFTGHSSGTVQVWDLSMILTDKKTIEKNEKDKNKYENFRRFLETTRWNDNYDMYFSSNAHANDSE